MSLFIPHWSLLAHAPHPCPRTSPFYCGESYFKLHHCLPPLCFFSLAHSTTSRIMYFILLSISPHWNKLCESLSVLFIAVSPVPRTVSGTCKNWSKYLLSEHYYMTEWMRSWYLYRKEFLSSCLLQWKYIQLLQLILLPNYRM